jgi:hypothetical protein
MTRQLLSHFLLLFLSASLEAAPTITEFLSDNSNGLTDEDGDYSDWIEIYNPDATPIDLAGWHLTDNATNLTLWTFPSHTLAQNEYLIVFASGKQRAISGSELHTNFALSRSGGFLALIAPNSTTTSSFNYPSQKADVSYGATKTSNEVALISQSSQAKAIIPDLAYDTAVGTTWRDNTPAFDESAWLGGLLGVGFERSSNFEDEFGIDVEAAWSVNSTVYIRVPINRSLDPTNIQSLTLRMKYDDGFAAFINGTYAVGTNDPAPLLWNSDSNGDVTDGDAVVFQDFDISSSIPDLVTQGNLLAIHGMNRFTNSSDLLIRPELIATFTTPVPPVIGFFTSPTPGLENATSNLDSILGDTSFQFGRGFYTTFFTETITSTDPGATIIFTTDGSLPSIGNGTQIPAPDPSTVAQAAVPIATTTVLRAIAIRDNAIPTNVDTQTYLFHADVLTQNGAGLPSPPNNTSIWDYLMDPNVVNDPRLPNLEDDLKSIPSLSITLPAEDMWGTSGIYANPRQSGAAWERACSVEYLLLDGSSGFQQDAGIRIQGAGSRFRDLGKKSLRIAFRNQYGKGKLDYPLFNNRAAGQLDNIVLRGAYFDSWTVHTTGSGTEGIGRRNAMLLRDEFGRQSHQAMGASPVVQGNWAHLYFNGIYWGVYNLHERIDEHFAEDRFGGDDAEYDVLKQRPRGQSNGSSPEVVNGDLVAWNTLLSTLRGNIASQTVYDSARQLMDVDSFADYLILNFWGANLDWPHNNWYAVRHRPTDGPFTFIAWDVENFIFVTNATGPLSTTTNNSPGVIWSRLRRNKEFMTYFADRVQKHCFNQGALTSSENIARFSQISSHIRPAMNIEAARWGDTREEPPMNAIDQFDPLIDQKVTRYFPARTTIFLNQLRSNNIFPRTDAPIFSQHGDQIIPGTTVTIGNPNASGTIYLTTDGSDPRLQGGAINPLASSSNSATIGEPTSLLARIRSTSGEWSALASADFITASDPLPGNLVISEIHYHPADASPDEILAGHTDQDDFEFIELTNSTSGPLDLTNLAFTAGIQFSFVSLSPGDRLLPAQSRIILVRSSDAFAFRYGALSVLGQYGGSLDNKGEAITLSLNGESYLTFEFNDKVPWPESSDGSGHSLVLTCPVSTTDSHDPLSWQSSPSINGSPLSSDIILFSGNASGDDNSDGVSNLLHFAQTNSPDSPPTFSVSFDGLQGTFSFQRNLAAHLTYSAEYSLDLDSWISLDESTLLSITRNGNGTAIYTFQSPESANISKTHFFRLRVSVP